EAEITRRAQTVLHEVVPIVGETVLMVLAELVEEVPAPAAGHSRQRHARTEHRAEFSGRPEEGEVGVARVEKEVLLVQAELQVAPGISLVFPRAGTAMEAVIPGDEARALDRKPIVVTVRDLRIVG